MLHARHRDRVPSLDASGEPSMGLRKKVDGQRMVTLTDTPLPGGDDLFNNDAKRGTKARFRH